MAKGKKSVSMDDVIALLNESQKAGENQKAILKKVQAVRKALDELEALVSGGNDGDAPTTSKAAREVDPEAPFGKKKDGTPKARPGRASAAQTL